MLREIVLDTETTGLDPKSGHRVIEIGCVELINHMPTGGEYHEYINPRRDVPREAFAIHGLSTEMLMDKPLFEDLADGFLEFIGDAQLIIHNASFDIGFLNWELSAIDRPNIEMGRVTDTLAIARRKHAGSPNNLDALCKRYKIDNSSREVHGALLDSQLLAEVYLELIGGKQSELGLAADQVRSSGGGERAVKISQRPNPLEPRISIDEATAHSEFVETLGKDAIWKKLA